MTDVLPAGVTFVSASTGCTRAGQTVTCALPDLADGVERTATISVTAVSGQYDNVATLAADGVQAVQGRASVVVKVSWL